MTKPITINELITTLSCEAKRLKLADIKPDVFAPCHEVKILPFEGAILVMRRRKGDHEVGGPKLCLSSASELLEAWLKLSDGDAAQALDLLTKFSVAGFL